MTGVAAECIQVHPMQIINMDNYVTGYNNGIQSQFNTIKDR
jgi:hypothetical protein